MSVLVGNPEDRFSLDKVHMIIGYYLFVAVIVIDRPAQPDGTDVDIEPENKGDNPGR